MTETVDLVLSDASQIECLYGVTPLEVLAESTTLTRPDQRFRASVTLDPEFGWVPWSDLSR